MIFYTIYTSRPMQPMSIELLEEITTESVKNNKKTGRHYELTQWIQGCLDERVFSEWSMGSWILTNEKLEGLDAILEPEQFLEKPTTDTSQ